MLDWQEHASNGRRGRASAVDLAMSESRRSLCAELMVLCARIGFNP